MSWRRTYRDYLRDMEIAALDCLEFIEGMDYGAFNQDRKTQATVAQRIAVIGEAANQIPANIRLQMSGMPWNDVIGMRNKLIHEYYGISIEIIWQTIQEDLPPLRREISRIPASS